MYVIVNVIVLFIYTDIINKKLIKQKFENIYIIIISIN